MGNGEWGMGHLELGMGRGKGGREKVEEVRITRLND